MVTASLTIYGEAIPVDPHNWIKEATQDIAKRRRDEDLKCQGIACVTHLGTTKFPDEKAKRPITQFWPSGGPHLAILAFTGLHLVRFWSHLVWFWFHLVWFWIHLVWFWIHLVWFWFHLV